jgi:hypothetical protein
MGSGLRVLVISPSTEGWFLPCLFTQAGWSCDVVSLSGVFATSSHVRALHRARGPEELAGLALHLHTQVEPYDWVVPASDDVLGELCFRSLLDQRFLSLLPVDAAAARHHLFSKINFSRALDLYGLPTPRWSIATSSGDALRRAEELGYPCFLKRDRSSGGKGTFHCGQAAELEAAAGRLAGSPFLMQQAITGELWSVEALYWHTKLKAFSLSTFVATTSSFGPSVERRYGAGSEVMPGVLPLLEGLGRALSAHGWANISLVKDAADGHLYFIEADLRPNAWIALDQYLGGDFACAISSLLGPSSPGPKQCYLDTIASPLAVAHFQRLVQIGASPERIQQAMTMRPDESDMFYGELIRNRFYAPLV